MPEETTPAPADSSTSGRYAPTSDALTQAYLNVMTRLEGFAEFDAEYVDGYLTALACAPLPLSATEAMRELAADGYERCFADPADLAAADDAFSRYLARIVGQLDVQALEQAGPGAGLDPYMLSWDTEANVEQLRAEGITDDEMALMQDGATWANGFFTGLEFAEKRCPTPLTPAIEKRQDECLQQIMGLMLGNGGPEFTAHLRRWWPGRKPTREQLIDTALQGAEDYRLNWLEAALTPSPRVAESKAGRNDPCPCGSGKKFKKCHGA